MLRLFGKKEESKKHLDKEHVPKATPQGELSPSGPKILVIDSEAHDWKAAFGSSVQLEQGEWESMMVVSEGNRATVHLRGRKGKPFFFFKL